MVYVHSLGFNLPSETEEATRLLYELNPNKNFSHVIVDLQFPLEYGGDIPDDIEESIKKNTAKLERIAHKYGSYYFKAPNVGVSQNWNAVLKEIQSLFGFTEKDVLICADPDERPMTANWVQAIADVLTNPKMAACALVMPLQKEFLLKNPSTCTKSKIKNHEVFLINGTLSMAQVGFSGKYLLANEGVPVPDGHAKYGYLESAFAKSLRGTGMGWAILSDYYCEHTECSTLYREWKTDITSGKYIGVHQISFYDWLVIQKEKENE